MGNWLVAPPLLIIVLAGCAGGDDDKKIYELTSGTYVLSDVDVQNDGCELDPVANFTAQSVAVSGDAVTVGVLDLTRDGNSLEGSGDAILDQTPNDCLLDFAGTGSGNVSGTDEFNLEYEIVLSENSGTECGNLGIPLPCATHFSYHAEK